MEAYFRQLLYNQSWLFELLNTEHEKLTTELNSVFKHFENLITEQSENNQNFEIQFTEEALTNIAKDIDENLYKKDKIIEYSQRLLLDISALKHSIFKCEKPEVYTSNHYDRHMTNIRNHKINPSGLCVKCKKNPKNCIYLGKCDKKYESHCLCHNEYDVHPYCSECLFEYFSSYIENIPFYSFNPDEFSCGLKCPFCNGEVCPYRYIPVIVEQTDTKQYQYEPNQMSLDSQKLDKVYSLLENLQNDFYTFLNSTDKPKIVTLQKDPRTINCWRCDKDYISGTKECHYSKRCPNPIHTDPDWKEKLNNDPNWKEELINDPLPIVASPKQKNPAKIRNIKKNKIEQEEQNNIPEQNSFVSEEMPLVFPETVLHFEDELIDVVLND